MEASRDAPAVVRRRRKIARQQREQTPEAAKFGKLKNSDEDSSSFSESHRDNKNNPPEPPKRTVEPCVHREISGHLSKILNRRDRNINSSAVRSLSSPREAKKVESPAEVQQLLKHARRSLSSPRHKEETSSTSTRSPTPERNQNTVRQPRPPSRSTINNTNNAELTQFEKNIMRFEEERRRFMQEKKRFEAEKRELDAMRKRRTEELDKKRIISGHSFNRMGERNRIHAPNNDKEKLELIKNFQVAQKLSVRDDEDVQLHSDREKKSQRSSRPSDYESSTASCTETEDEADIEFKGAIEAVSNDAPKAKQEILVKWVQETQSMTFDDDGKPKIVDPNDELISDSNDATLTASTPEEETQTTENFKTLRASFFADARLTWRQLKIERVDDIDKIKLMRNKCLSDLVILIIFCGFGGMLFRFVEGSFENVYKCGVKKVKRDFIDQLWVSSHNMRF